MMVVVGSVISTQVPFQDWRAYSLVAVRDAGRVLSSQSSSAINFSWRQLHYPQTTTRAWLYWLSHPNSGQLWRTFPQFLSSPRSWLRLHGDCITTQFFLQYFFLFFSNTGPPKHDPVRCQSQNPLCWYQYPLKKMWSWDFGIWISSGWLTMRTPSLVIDLR